MTRSHKKCQKEIKGLVVLHTYPSSINYSIKILNNHFIDCHNHEETGPFKNPQKVIAQHFVGRIPNGPIRFHLLLVFKSTLLPLGARCSPYNAAHHRGN